MSKLYKQYTLLKIKNPDTLYLFECGIFYIFIHDDACLMSNILDLKLTNLNSDIKKCGFPIKSADKYLSILKSLNYNIQIISRNVDSFSTSTNIEHYIAKQGYYSIIQDFLNLNIDELSISKAFDLLYEFQFRFKQIANNTNFKE